MPKNYKLFLPKPDQEPKRRTHKVAIMFSILLLMGFSMWIHYVPSPPPQTQKVSELTTKINTGPQVTYSTENHPQSYGTHTVYSASLPRGTTKITQAGVYGVMTITYKTVIIDGKPHRSFVDGHVTKEPVEQITTVGTGS